MHRKALRTSEASAHVTSQTMNQDPVSSAQMVWARPGHGWQPLLTLQVKARIPRPASSLSHPTCPHKDLSTPFPRM